jgi:hypothetical protein
MSEFISKLEAAHAEDQYLFAECDLVINAVWWVIGGKETTRKTKT